MAPDDPNTSVSDTDDHLDIDFRRAFEIDPERRLLVKADAPKFTMLAASDTYLELVGKRRRELLGRGVFEVFPESPSSDQALLREALEEVARDNQPRSLAAYRYDIPDPDDPGESVERYWSPSLLPMIDSDGELSGILLRVEEVTDSVLRERYMYRRHSPMGDEQQKQRTVLLVESSTGCQKSLAQSLRIHWQVDVADNAREAMKRLDQTAVDLVLTAMELPDQSGAQFISQLKEQTDAPVIARVSQTDGKRFARAFEAGADDVIGGPASAREVIARVQAQFAESALREATQKRVHRQYRQLFMQAPVAISVLEGPEKIYTLANPRLHEIVGQRELIGRPLRDVLPEPDLQPIFDRLDEVYETGEPYFAAEQPVSLDHKDKQRYVTFSYQPFRDPDGTIRGVASFAYEVTEQVEMRQAVEKESERKDVFLATLGHELRNPMTPMVHAAEMLEEKTEQYDDEQLDWISDAMSRQVDQLQHHVDDLLDVARVQHGKINIEQAVVELDDVVDPAVEAVETSVEQRRQHLSVDSTDEQLLIDVDAPRITQVLTNLLDNASKYTPAEGHIWLQIQRNEQTDDRDELVIRVRDDGEGIDPELLPDLFDLFTRAEVSLDRSKGGLGLGLSLVKGIVEMHGGQVRAHSEGPGEGSCFVVELPEVVVPAGKRRSTTEVGELDDVRVLIVDDIPEITTALARQLQGRGATTYTATSGAEGIEVARQCKPTHILLDVGLPDIDGYEVARRLRELPETADTPIAALTGYGMAGDIEKAHQAGFDRHLTKPASGDELAAFLTETPPD